MHDRIDDEYDRDDRPNGAVAEVLGELEPVRDDFPEDHLDYTTCSNCNRRYRTGENHTCPAR